MLQICVGTHACAHTVGLSWGCKVVEYCCFGVILRGEIGTADMGYHTSSMWPSEGWVSMWSLGKNKKGLMVARPVIQAELEQATLNWMHAFTTGWVSTPSQFLSMNNLQYLCLFALKLWLFQGCFFSSKETITVIMQRSITSFTLLTGI